MGKAKSTETGDLLALLAKALTERFPQDPSCPGIHIAHVPARDGRSGVLGRTSSGTEIHGLAKPSAPAFWYVAAQRFTGSYGAGRINVDKEEGEDLDEVIFKLASRIAAGIPVIRAQLQLARAVKP